MARRGLSNVGEAGVDLPKASNPVILIPVSEPAPKGMRLRSLMIAVALIAFSIWLLIKLGRLILVGAVAFVIVFAIALAIVLAKRNASQQESLLLSLAIAAERSMPLPPAALAFVDQFGATYRWRVRLFASLLEEGFPVPEAIDHVPQLLDREARVMAKTGWNSGRFAEGLREAAATRSARKTLWGTIGGQFLYFGFVLVVMQIVTVYLMYFTVPKFIAIFQDFGVTLPPVTQFTIDVSSRFTEVPPLMLLLLTFELMVFFVLPLGVMSLFQWNIPPLDWLFRRQHASLILRALALSAEGGKPIVNAVEMLARDYPSSWARVRLCRVCGELNSGEDWVSALEIHGLIRDTDAAVIASASRVGNLVWALRETAASSDRRLGYWLQFVLQMIAPLVLMGVGLMVLVFSVAYFYPIIILIERLT
jgi:type II secretory pathway component PulF